MDVSASALSAISQARTKGQIDIAVAKKAQDAQKQTGQAVVGMLQSLANNAKNGVAADGRLDLTA